MTGEYNPTPPYDVKAEQRNGSRIEVTWQPPITPNGIITGYDVFMTPPIPPALVHPQQKTHIIIDDVFEAGKTIILLLC